MDDSPLWQTAANFAVQGIANSKAAQNAKEEILGRFWQWLRPRFARILPALESAPTTPETQHKVQELLRELLKNEDFKKELAAQVEALKAAGIREKNIVKGDIEQVDEATIGDTGGSGEPTQYERKNVAEGNVKNVRRFTLGDGH